MLRLLILHTTLRRSAQQASAQASPGQGEGSSEGTPGSGGAKEKRSVWRKLRGFHRAAMAFKPPRGEPPAVQAQPP